jgi:hypothetical protein
MHTPGSCAVALALVVVCVSPAIGQQSSASAGRIKVASGAATIVRQGVAMPAKPGELVFEADGLRTGGDGRLGVTLKDDSRISLGPNSEVRLDRFLFAPATDGVGFGLTVLRGLLAYISGRIAKLSPDAVRLETPSAILGVRGTHLVVRVDAP